MTKKRWLAQTVSVLIAANLLTVPAFAAETPLPAATQQAADGVMMLTIDQAKALALQNSKDYQQAKLDVDRAWEVRDDSTTLLKFTPLNPADAANAAALNRTLTSDLNWQVAKKTQGARQDTVEAQTIQRYLDVLNAQKKVNAAQKALEAAEWKLRAARAGKTVGTVSATSVVSAEANAAGAKATLVAAQEALKDAYVKFDILLGINVEQRPVLTEQPVFRPINVENLDYEVAKALVNSPSVFNAQYTVDIKKAVRMAASPFKTGQIDINKAELDYSKAKETTDKTVRGLYYSLKQMEEQHEGLTEALRNAEESYRVAKVQYDVGLITRIELVSAESQLASAQRDLFDLICRHEQSKQSFEKPWTSGS
ncbi:TolC family protein [Heliobacterium undosum]|uniref:TolC family protein n=1 Tax=Heliomicrobium undosum TaxID=121734 RepID=A0A845L715_9FIRM|nr:TolC family protein [Heliomicrobium undosum]MZP29528.1 TolC family protein [Heliomicrobium undosum]